MLDNSKILIVGGSFDESGGKLDIKIDSMFSYLEGAMIINGGLPSFLEELIKNKIKDYTLVFYFSDYMSSTIEAALAANKVVVIKNISEEINETKELSLKVQELKSHILINILENKGETIYKVIDLSGKVFFETNNSSCLLDKLKEESILRDAVQAVPFKETVISKEPIVKMERLHLRVINDTIDILYRPVHTYIEFVNNDNTGKERIKELLSMTREEFAKYLETGLLCKISVKKEKVTHLNGTHDEDWWLGAWKMQTDKILNEIGMSNVVEEPIWRE